MTPIDRRAIKQRAKTCYAHHGLPLLAAAALSALLSAAVKMVCSPWVGHLPAGTVRQLASLLVSGFSFLVSAPAAFGFAELCSRAEGGEPLAVSNIFLWYGEGYQYKTAMLGQLWLSWLTLETALAAVALPVTVLLAASIIPLQLTRLVGFALILSCMFRFMVNRAGIFVLAQTPSFGVREAFRFSQSILFPRQREFFLLLLSFLPLYLPSFLVYLPPFSGSTALSLCAAVYSLALEPYFLLSQLLYFREACGRVN